MHRGIKTSFLLAEYKRFTKDSTSDNETIGKTRINNFYTKLLSLTNNFSVEKTKYGDLIANQRSYLLPPDVITVKQIRVYIGSTWYDLVPVLSLDNWAYFTATVMTNSIPSHFTVRSESGRMYIELDGIPSDTGTDNLEITYEGYHDPLLFPSDYATGTITVSQGSENVAGVSTVFASSMVGRFIQPTNAKFWYEIKTVGSTLALTLVNYFQESDVSASAFTIAELQRTPAEYHYTPIYGAAAEYYRPINQTKAREYEALYNQDVLLIENKYKAKTTGRVFQGKRVGSVSNFVPRNYPKSSLTTY